MKPYMLILGIRDEEAVQIVASLSVTKDEPSAEDILSSLEEQGYDVPHGHIEFAEVHEIELGFLLEALSAYGFNLETGKPSSQDAPQTH